ncbi:MAG: insulinase family protein [Chlorobia bacterium]|nr:insulinase family protein [Fimbriimonadaceae bacterium]
MLALALSVALLHLEEPPRLRTISRNGAAILVERMPDEPMISVQLWASARSVPETSKTHGWRHLLEHLIARGKGDLDRRLETNGSYLRARTFRDAMQIEINVGPRQLDLAISAVTEILRPLETSQAQIEKEVDIMRQEFATYENSSRLNSAAWFQAYGEPGLDPFGKLETISQATPDGLRDLQRKHFYPENLVLSIAGPVDVKQATALANAAIGMKQGAIRVPDKDRAGGKPGRVETDGYGEGRAALVGSFDRPQTVGALAFALSVGSGEEGAFVTYTPSIFGGLVIVGQTEKQSGIGLKIDGIGSNDWPHLFALGKILARNWIGRYLTSASGVAYFRGLLLCQSHASRPEAMLQALDRLTLAEFTEAGQSFSKEKAVTVVGS